MKNLALLCSPSTEKAIRNAGFESLESLAFYVATDDLTRIAGIGKKKAEGIEEVLIKQGLRTKFSNEELFLIGMLGGEDNPEIAQRLWDSPLSEAQKKYLKKIIATMLTAREQEVFKLHYGLGCDRMALEEIGKTFYVTRERVRQILAKGHRKLMLEKNREKLELAMMDRLQLQRELVKTQRKLDSIQDGLACYDKLYGPTEDFPIEVLDLSIRSYNCLKRAGIRTIEEAKKADLTTIRNMGHLSLEEVIEKIANFSAS